MIKPHKHMNLDISVLRVSAFVIKKISKRGAYDMESLRRYLCNKFGQDAELVFLPVLNLLFLLGKIRYYPKNDTIEYIEG